MRKYETVCVLSPELQEDDIKKLKEKMFSALGSKGGIVLKVQDWGKKKLAYPIKKFKKGFYFHFEHAGNGESVAELERNLRLDTTVLRYLTVKIADEVSEEELKAVKQDSEKEQKEEDIPSFSSEEKEEKEETNSDTEEE